MVRAIQYNANLVTMVRASQQYHAAQITNTMLCWIVSTKLHCAEDCKRAQMCTLLFFSSWLVFSSMNWSHGILLLPHGHSAHGLLTQASLPPPAGTLHRMRLTLMDTWRGSVVRWLGTGRSLLCGFPPSGSVWSWPGEPPGSPCPILASNERAVASRFESFSWHEI